ncbi:hypothetical protein B0F90DRAFT_1916548 [Multifurca ochricompacta]|uniref:Zn(2)-C6 fungal-type domain-containing protein n=1 Tax=Multifurca ochricompacta TaxID=376703 RepID=A0AAD4M9N6_9AGAM|nr:hypothetical protein B0F90DRAFT_1916548 [Multifurca ochricompacta]
MEEQERSPSPSRSSLPPPLHRHLRSAPQSPRRLPNIATNTPTVWSGVQRSTTDPAFYTYPPPPNTSRESVILPTELQKAEATHGWHADIPQADGPFWDERFPHPQRIGHAESYTRADDSSWGGSHSSPRRTHSLDWRPVPLEQYEGYSLPEGLSARVYDRPHLNPSDTFDQADDRLYNRPATPHGLPGLSSPDNFVSPLLESVLLGVPGPPTTVDGSSSEAGQGDSVEDESPKRFAQKGKQSASSPQEEEFSPLRRFKKKTEIACNFCRGRKLGCSGDRPKCKACAKREGECIYASTPRRRGPGKAPRGSRKLAKGRGTGSRTQLSTSRVMPSAFPNLSFEVPFPQVQAPGVNSYESPPDNGAGLVGKPNAWAWTWAPVLGGVDFKRARGNESMDELGLGGFFILGYYFLNLRQSNLIVDCLHLAQAVTTTLEALGQSQGPFPEPDPGRAVSEPLTSFMRASSFAGPAATLAYFTRRACALKPQGDAAMLHYNSEVDDWVPFTSASSLTTHKSVVFIGVITSNEELTTTR